MAAAEEWLWDETEWQCQCERKPCCGRSRCLTGKNQTSKINITGKAWTAVAWTDGSLAVYWLPA